jgi:hypothetical protein
MQNARFWEFINDDWVKVTLQPNQILAWENCSKDWEGYNLNHYRWSHEGDKVVCECTNIATDCDGRFDRFSEYECHLSQLQGRSLTSDINRNEFELSLHLPSWVERDYQQRDYAAERMNY